WLYNALNHLVIAPRALAQYAAAKGVPAPVVMVYLGGVLLLVGAVTILLGVHVPLGVAALLVFLVPVTLWVHNFWSVHDPVQRMVEMVQFTKNVALIGATLLLLAIPEQWWSLGP
ncbi:MAG: DoxX family protein, partial [Candidatus Kapabacteria bacterium]|nr:DoxX family protein [Candidatus Kapabacteria bacterium]MDW7997191.1 DoxX family protein [Bacteroidota bacterium]